MFKQQYDAWLQSQIMQEKNHRRRELLEKGLSRGTEDFLREIWYPVVGNFDHLYPEWEVRDLGGGYRYLDLAYLPPGGMKGDIEIQDYRSHARDLDTRRFKDLCRRQSMLSLDGWIFLPVAYLSIKEEPEFCKQLVLSFVGKFLSMETDGRMDWLEAETVRYASRVLRPFAPGELAAHLRVTVRHARKILHRLADAGHLAVTGGKQRYRTYQIPIAESLRGEISRDFGSQARMR